MEGGERGGGIFSSAPIRRVSTDGLVCFRLPILQGLSGHEVSRKPCRDLIRYGRDMLYDHSQRSLLSPEKKS